MGFWKKLYQAIFGHNFTEADRKIFGRIRELKEEENRQKRKSRQIESQSIDIEWFNLSTVLKSDTNKDFVAPKRGKISTMKDLLEERKRREQERRKELEAQVRKCFAAVDVLLDRECIDQAEKLLFQIAPVLNELKIDDLSRKQQGFIENIASLKETIRQREIKRQEEERRRKEEEERRRIEEEQRKEQERLKEQRERERKAREYEEKLEQQAEKLRLEVARLTSLVTQPKENAHAFLQYLKMKNVHYFYHFTDKNNLPSIRKFGGLYSWYYCSQNDINIPNAGGDAWSRELDSRYGLEDYVRLSFCDDHPMAYRKHKEGAQLVLLRIKIDVACFKDTIFSDVNAAASHQHGGKLEDLERVNIRATQKHFVSRNDADFSEHQAECMVKTFIPTEYITNIDNPPLMHFN